MKEFNENEKFIFVSYAHKDADRVFPIVRALKNKGFNIWCDENLEHGADYHDDIATHILNCTTALIFITAASANSEYCQNEIKYAHTNKKKLAIVYLDKDVELKSGIHMLLSSIQHIAYHNYKSHIEFLDALFKSESLRLCLNETTASSPVVIDAKKEEKKKEPTLKNKASCRGERSHIGEYFTFTSERVHGVKNKTELCYAAYNELKKRVGYVHEYYEKNKETPALHMAELCFPVRYKDKMWCRFTSHGERISWSYLRTEIESKGAVEMYID